MSWNDPDPLKDKARRAVQRAVRSGKLRRPTTCDRCGNPGLIQGHHPDYARPLDVLWLCTTCHTDEHVDLRRAIMWKPIMDEAVDVAKRLVAQPLPFPAAEK